MRSTVLSSNVKLIGVWQALCGHVLPVRVWQALFCSVKFCLVKFCLALLSMAGSVLSCKVEYSCVLYYAAGRVVYVLIK